MKTGRFHLQALTLTRASGDRRCPGPFGRLTGTLSFTLRRDASAIRGDLLLAAAFRRLLVKLLQLRKEPSPPRHELPYTLAISWTE